MKFIEKLKRRVSIYISEMRENAINRKYDRVIGRSYKKTTKKISSDSDKPRIVQKDNHAVTPVYDNEAKLREEIKRRQEEEDMYRRKEEEYRRREEQQREEIQRRKEEEERRRREEGEKKRLRKRDAS